MNRHDELRVGDLVAVRVGIECTWKRALVIELNRWSVLILLNDQSLCEVLRSPNYVRPIRLAYCRPRAVLGEAS